jgi:hypothetical protein
MKLEEFKRIWWMEYLHRQWGRTIGAVFFLPAAFFWSRGYFNKGMKIRAAIFGTLIGCQVKFPVALQKLDIIRAGQLNSFLVVSVVYFFTALRCLFFKLDTFRWFYNKIFSLEKISLKK